MFTTLTIDFFIRSRAANSVACGWIVPNFELIQTFMHVLVTTSPIISLLGFLLTIKDSSIRSHWSDLAEFRAHSIIKKNRSKMKVLECYQHFLHYSPMGAICCHGNQSYEPIWPKTSSTPMMLQIKFNCDRHSVMFECVHTHRQRLYKLTLCAFGSGELKPERSNRDGMKVSP